MSAVTQEHARLHEGEQGQVGVWVAEAPFSLDLSAARIAELEAELGISLDHVIVSETGARYFEVAGTPAQLLQPLQQAGFTSITPVPQSLKISPRIVAAAQAAAAAGGGEDAAEHGLRVHLTPRAAGGDVDAHALSASWAGVVATALGHPRAVVSAAGATAVKVEGLTRLEAHTAASELAKAADTRWIEPATRFRSLNMLATGVVQSGFSDKTPLWDIGLHGEGQIVGVGDSGLDYNSCYFTDPAVPVSVATGATYSNANHRKVIQYVAFASNQEGEDGGHGTHVCGSVAGYGAVPSASGAEYKGVAYNAKLAFYDIGVPKAQYLSLPNNLNLDFFPPAFSVGARIHSNSWGGASNTYTVDAQEVDMFSWTNQDFLVLVAAGNDGEGSGGTVWDGQATVGTPATSKSCVAVCASENDEPAYGTDKNHVASFSSRGPTSDGRYKPDICAPGMYIESAKSSASLAATCAHTFMAGTSMATPITAGLTALVRQYFTDGYYPGGVKTAANALTPMAALLKAMLINSARVLTGTEATRQGKATVPSMDQGFGAVDMDSTLVTPASPAGLKLEVHGAWSAGCTACPKVSAGETVTYNVVLASTTNGLPLKVTLVWSDYYAAANAAKSLINDLDLTVVQGSTTTYPNGKTSKDNLNTAEHVVITNPVAGASYSVKVTGAAVTKGPQPFAVVISGPLQVASNCASSPCLNGGSCSSTASGYTCACAAGFSGLNCETVATTCSSSPCKNGATCANTSGGYVCTCAPGWTGTNCNTATACTPSPCKNGATCAATSAGGYTCSCTTGFSGVNCETAASSCASSPCVNGATCSNLSAGYKCACLPGYSGTNCETNINECVPNPCKNGGFCEDGVNSFTCSCQEGFTGPTCATVVDACTAIQCLNGGTCKANFGTYECLCKPGYSGVFCETDVNECAGVTCQHGGTCQDQVNSFLCLCSPGYKGTLCESWKRRVYGNLQLSGITAAAFGAPERSTFIAAVAAVSDCDANQVSLLAVVDVAARRARQLAAAGVDVEFQIAVDSAAEADAAAAAVQDSVESNELLTELAVGDSSFAAVTIEDSAITTESSEEGSDLPFGLSLPVLVGAAAGVVVLVLLVALAVTLSRRKKDPLLSPNMQRGVQLSQQQQQPSSRFYPVATPISIGRPQQRNQFGQMI